MSYVKWGFILLVWLIVGAFLHYTLPQYDIVRIVNTEVQRIDFGSNSIFWAGGDTGTSETQVNRDVRFIETFYADGEPMVFRNEDTGWGWPPYFKLDSSNLQAEARDLISTAAEPQWVALRHYGWRNEWFSIFPNALSVRPVAGPDETVVNWTAIVVLVLLAALVWAVWVRWRRFRRTRLQPAWAELEENWDAAGAAADSRRGRLREWWARQRRR